MRNRTTHLAIFAKQFASMLNSGLQLVSVLENLARETPQRQLREAVRDVARQANGGTDVADAFARHPKLFDGVFVGVTRTGLETGKLGEALLQVADYLERADQVHRRMAAAIVYPLFLLATFFAAAGGMIFYILPKYQTLFASFGHDLPAPTQFLIDVGDTLRGDGVSIAIVLSGGLLLSVLAVSTASGKRSWDRLKLHIPLLGQVWRLSALARFSRTLAVQVRNQIPLVRSLRLAAIAAGNSHIEQLVLAIATDIEEGASVTHAFKSRDIFAGIVLQMIAAGEEAGSLAELLITAAAYFDSLLLQRIETLTGMINPVLTAVMGLSIAGMMIAAYLPVLDLPGVMG